MRFNDDIDINDPPDGEAFCCRCGRSIETIGAALDAMCLPCILAELEDDSEGA